MVALWILGILLALILLVLFLRVAPADRAQAPEKAQKREETEEA